MVIEEKEDEVLIGAVRDWAAANREIGGDLVLESLSDGNILYLGSLTKVIMWVEMELERALNARWGEDEDPELLRYQDFQEWLSSYRATHVDDTELDW
jgi:hypothetical protein|tara:strand:- start:604 stop:897 length:294 start_codon:yes stop_codon:yes gene_type:complete